LIDADDVQAVSFTAPEDRRYGRPPPPMNIRYQTEMGGKNVAIVMRDADLDLAASLTAAGVRTPDKCTATSRVVIAREVEGDFLDRLRSRIAALPLGPVTDPASAIGPVISAASRDSIRRVLEGSNAGRVYVGDVPSSGDFANGYFVAPTVVLRNAPPTPISRTRAVRPRPMRVSRPTISTTRSRSPTTPWPGLSASLFTRPAQALRYVDQIAVGMVRVNGDTTGVDPHAPFGGMSSSSGREQGLAAREFYTEIKTVQRNA
jgi:aldehyde dehydrogenase (NAD+)